MVWLVLLSYRIVVLVGISDNTVDLCVSRFLVNFSSPEMYFQNKFCHVTLNFLVWYPLI